MKIVRQRVFPITLNHPVEHTESLGEGTLIKFYWNIALDVRRDRFFRHTSYSISQLIFIEVYSYGQRVHRYCNRWMHGYDQMDALKTKKGLDISFNASTVRMTTLGPNKECNPRGHKGKPLIYPSKIAVQRLQ